MKVHSEERILPYRASQILELVADVERYPEFLPWCTGARLRERRKTGDDVETITADLMIGFKMVRERFTSRVIVDRKKQRIDVEYVDGPFRHLKNHWTFIDSERNYCRVDFYLEFEFSSVLLQKLIGVLFHEAVRRMVSAFESRAHQLYGDSPAL